MSQTDLISSGVGDAERATIDRSVRLPVLLFFGSAIFWLLVASLLGLVAAIQLNYPSFLDGFAFTTFGRVRPACLNALVYGWASAAGIGAGIWMMARLCRVIVSRHALLVVAGLFWNAGVLIGVLSILAGYSQSIEWLEFPSFASGFLFIAYVLIAIRAVITFRFRQRGAVYVSQWYLMAAFLCFPWMYATANTFLVWHTIQGSAQAPINWWYMRNVFGLWLTPIGLASAYYFIPRIIGRPIYSYRVSILAFWSLLLFYAWSGMSGLIGGPIPAWMVSASVVASILLFIPVILVGINHHVTMWGRSDALYWSPTLRFTIFGAAAFTLVGLETGLMAFPSFNRIIQFTDWTVGHSFLGVYAFFTMMMFGAVYYIVPRLIGCEWPASWMTCWHFRLTAFGVGLIVLSLSLGGLIQGFALDDPGVEFMTSVQMAAPFRWFAGACGLLLVAGHLLFAIHFVRLLLRFGVSPVVEKLQQSNREISEEAVRI